MDKNYVIVGQRVGAIQSADSKKNIINLFGYGIYEGDFPCPHLDGIKNPKIKLDSGKIVWGCQCWWAHEEKIQRTVKDYIDTKGIVNMIEGEEENNKKIFTFTPIDLN